MAHCSAVGRAEDAVDVFELTFRFAFELRDVPRLLGSDFKPSEFVFEGEFANAKRRPIVSIGHRSRWTMSGDAGLGSKGTATYFALNEGFPARRTGGRGWTAAEPVSLGGGATSPMSCLVPGGGVSTVPGVYAGGAIPPATRG